VIRRDLTAGLIALMDRTNYLPVSWRWSPIKRYNSISRGYWWITSSMWW